MKYYVYAYRTPIEIEIKSKNIIIPQGECFYIGKGQNRRKYDHLNENPNRTTNRLKYSIIQKIKEKNKTPIIEIIEESDNEKEMLDLEISYIKKYGKIIDKTGYLANLTNGGEGTSGYSHPDELKKHWSIIRKGKVPYNKGISRPGIGGRPTGTKWSDKTREKLMNIRSSPGYYDYCKLEKRRKKISDSKKGCNGAALGKLWYNNGSEETYQFSCPGGFVKGRLKKISNGKKGLLWYTNNIENKQFKENTQPEGWIRGRTLKK